MKHSREQVLLDTLQLLAKLADDWEYGGVVTENTDLFRDMGLGSLDVVVLAMSVQEHYGQVLPFADLFARLGQHGIRDLSVGQWADFVYENMNNASGEAK